MTNPEFKESFNLHEFVLQERLKELDDAALLIGYHASMMGLTNEYPSLNNLDQNSSDYQDQI
jgi:glutathione peroxidase-family protein